MPPKRSSTRKRGRATSSGPSVTDESPSIRRSRRSSTRNATIASQGTTTAQTPRAVDIPVVPQQQPAVILPPDLMESIASTVAAEVNKQLAAIHHPEVPQRSTLLPEISTARVVNDAISEAHSRITGEPHLLPTCNVTPPVVPSQVFLSSNLPIDSRVSAKIKGKIWNEEYLDFGVLLSNPLTDKYQLSFQNTGAGLPASLCLEPVSKPKRILNIETWQQAFYIFVGVYTQKYPHEAPALMKYGQTIRDLAARGQNWIFYDENFRYLRQTETSRLPWGAIHGELWLRAQSAPKAAPPSPNQGNSRTGLPSIPSGFCFKFHRGQFCSGNCGFHHTCFKCKGAHRHTQCNFRPPTHKNLKSDRPAKPTANASQTPASR